VRRLLVALAVLATTGGCAQPRQPTGGPPIDKPLQVVDVSPAPFSVVTELNRPVVIRFDERLSERLQGVRELRDAVIVSPETGDVRVRRGRRELRISVAGGWQPGLVYRVEVLPVLRDLFNNVREEPVELVFSTGPPIPETALAGFVEDRLTGQAVRGARVEATHDDSRHTYVVLSDSVGFFALRHVPEGRYEVQAWLDQNRNRIRDFAEPQDSARFTLAAQDTLVLELELLPRDTIPARLARVTPSDPTKFQLAFDDYFAPAPGPVPGAARIYRLEDSTYVAEGMLFHATSLDSLRAAEEALAAAARDTLAADTLVTDPDPEAAAPPAPPARRPEAPRPGRAAAQPRGPLPSRDLIVLLEAPLEPDTRYFVVVEGVINIQGVPGGGGTASFRTAATARPPADPAPPGDPPPDDGGDPPEDPEEDPEEGPEEDPEPPGHPDPASSPAPPPS
jgi:hypothetical protein